MFALRIVWIYMSISVVFCADTPFSNVSPLLKPAFSACELESNVKLDELKSMTLSEPLSQHLNCFIKCILQKFDLIKAGEIAVDKINEYLDKFAEDGDRTDLKKEIVKNCATEITAKQRIQHHTKVDQEELDREMAICMKKKHKGFKRGLKMSPKKLYKNMAKKPKFPKNTTCNNEPGTQTGSSDGNQSSFSKKNKSGFSKGNDTVTTTESPSEEQATMKKKTKSDSTYYAMCLYCNEAYKIESGGHPWLKCCIKKWSYKTCAGIKKALNVICDFCSL